jgi:hypothetical protein
MIGTEHYVKGLGHTEKDVLKEWGDALMTVKVKKYANLHEPYPFFFQPEKGNFVSH